MRENKRVRNALGSIIGPGDGEVEIVIAAFGHNASEIRPDA